MRACGNWSHALALPDVASGGYQRRMSLRQSFLSLALATSLAGCTSTPSTSDSGVDAHSTLLPHCQEIIDACHEVDPGSGPAHDCHEVAHDATMDSECEPVAESCVAMCNALRPDGSVPHDEDGGHSHDEDGGLPHGDGGH